MSQLDQLVQHRDVILLAEAVGWLHDYRKCSEEQLQAQSANSTAQGIARTELANRFNSLNSVSLTLSTTVEQLPNLLNQWSGQTNNRSASFLQQYLSRCHNTAHFDKQEPDDSGKQNYPGTRISTVFGFETAVGTNLTTQLWTLPWNSLTTFSRSNRNGLLGATQALFTTAGADTRRPINEINLWDWGLLVGALYKTAIAAVVLGHQPANRALRWQLLAVRTDALAYLTNVSRLPDLGARQNTLQVAINNVQALLEEIYPLATEVYRDENGSLYIVPNLPNLLTLQGNDDQTLQTYIQQQFTTDGEIVPQITLDPTAWWGQDPDRQGNDEIPPAGDLLASLTTLQSDVAIISEAWDGERQTVCPICGLRPCVNKQLDYCQVCGERRKGRVVEWLQDQSKTIWLDEVADRNGRLALITGTFDLSNWLDGSLVETLLVQEPINGSAVTKTPSFARMRRIWQTTQTFWEESQSNINQALTDARRRLKIQLASQPNLTQYQVYELDLHGRTRMSVLWDGNHLISTDNLSYTAMQLNTKLEDRKTPADAALAVGTWLEENKQLVFQLISDDERNRRFDIQIADIDYQDTAYATAIPILAQPRTFMSLVPANKALNVVNAIHTKYEREMGKVRNRLPLHLGLVYFHRRTPLRAALDAGRRMLKYESGMRKDEVWTVKCNAHKGTLPDEKKHLAEGTQQFAQTITVELEQNGRSLTWHVPVVMGDGVTPDNWYPYVFIKSDANGRSHTFKAPRPKSDGSTEACWLIHAAELKADDQVYFAPATLDFQWLDSTAQRFEIAYQNGRRRNHMARPYLLDDVDTLQQAWSLISEGLTSSQIYALRDLVETKRENWQSTAENWITNCQQPVYDENDQITQEAGMFWRFCHDAVVNANWKDKPTKEQFSHLSNWAVSGLFTDMIQLYMGIMKQKPQREDKSND